MLNIIRAAFALVGLCTLGLGLVVPLAVTGIATTLLPTQPHGSLVIVDGKVVGSALIGQNAIGGTYFHPRPSATAEPDPDHPGSSRDRPYNAAASGALNSAPSSAALAQAVRDRRAALGSGPIPADAVTASASGLDPHFSPANAMAQTPRIAAARNASQTSSARCNKAGNSVCSVRRGFMC